MCFYNDHNSSYKPQRAFAAYKTLLYIKIFSFCKARGGSPELTLNMRIVDHQCRIAGLTLWVWGGSDHGACGLRRRKDGAKDFANEKSSTVE